MTGRALGYCAGYSSPGYTKGPGMGLGRGWGRGRGIGYGRGLAWRRGGGRGFGGYWGYRAPIYEPALIPPTAYAPPATPETQLTMLKQEKDYLQSELKSIQDAITDISKRIEEMEKPE
jgi:hypothetical protein